MTVIYAQQPLQTCGLKTGCYKICFSLVFCKGKKSKSDEILIAINAFLKCSPHLIQGAGIDAESDNFCPQKLSPPCWASEGIAVTPLPVLQGRKPGLCSESCHVLLQLLFWISGEICVCVEGKEKDAEQRAMLLPCVCLQVTCCPAAC